LAIQESDKEPLREGYRVRLWEQLAAEGTTAALGTLKPIFCLLSESEQFLVLRRTFRRRRTAGTWEPRVLGGVRKVPEQHFFIASTRDNVPSHGWSSASCSSQAELQRCNPLF
jgi:hypothetical protein